MHEFYNMSRRQVLQAVLGAAGLYAWPGLAGAEAAKGIKLGLVTYQVGANMDLDTLITVCEKAGIGAVELRTTHKHGVEPSLDAEGRAKVKARFAKSSVVCRMLGTTCEFHSDKPDKVKENIKTTGDFIQLAADLGVWGVKVRPNGLRKDVPEEQTLKQIGTALKECGDMAKAKGIQLVVECHGTGTSHLPRMAKIMEYCGHPQVGLCWNSNDGDVKDGSIKEYFDLCRPWVRHCHIRSLTETNKYPWAELFKLFKETKYDGYVMLETKTDRDPVEFLKAEKAAFEKMI